MLFKKMVKYLGYKIDENGVSPNEINVIDELQIPTIKSELQKVLRIFQYNFPNSY